MADFIQVTPDFAVAGQLAAEDFRRAAAAGFKGVVNNRPDGEALGQMTDAQARAAAKAAGLAYWAVPVTGGTLLDGIAAERAALAEAGGPVLAYCRSGNRSIALWAMAQAETRGAEEVLRLAGRAGYDLSKLRPAIEAAARAQTVNQG
jgi:uncharacterized protein (TIGR01244 family)